jgi:tetratricopeptide (TPR) repeat protein
MQLGDFDKAIESLDKLLKLQPSNTAALLNRAIANLQSGKLDAAKRDYESLRESQPESAYQIYYGLAEVAQKQKDTSAALKNYKLYLKHAPKGTSEYENIQQRVKELESGKS